MKPPFEKTHLVPEHDDLDVLVRLSGRRDVGTSKRGGEYDTSRCRGARKSRRTMPEATANFQFRAPIDIVVPFTPRPKFKNMEFEETIRSTSTSCYWPFPSGNPVTVTVRLL
ncbi:MAG TPA: hypothetical protein VFC03_02715 [Acidimicrobiales bacterium]|nr:hypothetical protein [Acidimicrobiales bacterium]